MRFDVVVVLGMHWSGSSAITRADGDMKLFYALRSVGPRVEGGSNYFHC
jgi:hypothetical protein